MSRNIIFFIWRSLFYKNKLIQTFNDLLNYLLDTNIISNEDKIKNDYVKHKDLR